MSKVFVTGADGMLGNSICRELLKQGYDVKALSLSEEAAKTISGLPIEIVYGNILDLPLLRESIHGSEFVIHVAALASVWPRRSKKIHDVNVKGTENVAAVVEELGLTRMVHIGSAASFTEGSKDNPGDETSDYNGWRFGMDYIDSKYNAQKLLLEKYDKSAFPVIVINPTYMIGPFDSGPSSGKMIVEYIKGSIPGYSDGGKNFVASGDVASAAVNALKLGQLGQCYLAGNENLSYKELFQITAAILGRKFKLRKVPQFLILFIGIINSAIARISGRAPKLSYSMAKFAAVQQYYNPSKAVEELKMPQTPMEDGIRIAIEWFKENGYIRQY